jgi:rhamnogalacturonyl hydrolase YesR
MKGIIEIYNHRLNHAWVIILLPVIICGSDYFRNSTLPAKDKTMEAMERANKYFMNKWPDVGKTIITDRERVSNIWTRAVYYEGLMALYQLNSKPEYYDYAVRWGEYHNWNLRRGDTYSRNADNQCAGQTYIDLYLIDPKPERIKYIKMSIDSMINTDKIDDWNWIDALQMAMPVFAKLGALYKNDAYFNRMYEMYKCTKDSIGGGLYNHEDKLWWRDAAFKPPYTEPNGENCYWSRGNGWVFAALVRVLNSLPEENKYRAEILQNFTQMAGALIRVQRDDGFWNVSLHDPEHFGGKETTGTSLFTYGLAWGINLGILDEVMYKPVVSKAWNALINEALHENGFLGYVQGTGSSPGDGQPVGYNQKPNFEDYGLGCFLLAGSEVYKMTE